jgi:putative DNA primase/helicase
MTFNTHNLRTAAIALHGDVAGRNKVRCPGPGHSKHDRSLAVTFTDSGFLVHSFAGDDFRECRDHVKAALGCSDALRAANDNTAPPVNHLALVDEQHRIAKALRIWTQSISIARTLAGTYLASRGLTYHGEALRFHAGQRLMVALMTDAITGEPRGVHRTFLDATGKKVDRKMLGPSKGAVVRLSADEGVTHGLGIAEGIETALATGFQPVWACLSAGTLKAFPVLSGIEALTIFADRDYAGMTAANECGRGWHTSGREVTIAAPPEVGADFADLAEAA